MKTMMIVGAIFCCLIAGCDDGSEDFVRVPKSLPWGECRECLSSERMATHSGVLCLKESSCRDLEV